MDQSDLWNVDRFVLGLRWFPRMFRGINRKVESGKASCINTKHKRITIGCLATPKRERLK